MSTHSIRRSAGAAVTLAAAVLCTDAAAAQVARYHHPIGLEFTYPSGWAVEETELGMVLIPSDARRDAAGQPLELIVVNAQPTPGVTAADDPDVVEFFEQSSAPLVRVGDIESEESGLGPGAVLTFEGHTGVRSVRQRVYVTVHDGTSVYLLHMAREDLLDEREPAARDLFASLGWAATGVAERGRGTGAEGAPAGEIDPGLVRTWHRSSTTGSTGGGGSVYATDQEAIGFLEDGTVIHAVGTTVSAGTSDLSALSTSDPGVQRGQWSVEGASIVIRWDEGTAERLEYNVFTHTDGQPALKLQVPGGDPLYYR